MEIEIANYLTLVAEGRLSSESKEEIRIMLRAVSEIESIADSCNNLARTIKHRNEGKSVFTDKTEPQYRPDFRNGDKSIIPDEFHIEKAGTDTR